MPIRRSPNDARHPGPQAGRDPPDHVVAIPRNGWSRWIGISGRNQSEWLRVQIGPGPNRSRAAALGDD